MKDDRGELDLTKQIDNLKEQVDGYKALVELQKSQLWELRQSASQLEKTKNLLQGYQKVIQDLSYKLRRKCATT